MNKFIYSLIFVFFQFFSWSQDTIQLIEHSQNSPTKNSAIRYKIDKIDDRYYFTDVNRLGIKRPIGITGIMNISSKLAKEEQLKDLLRLTKKTKRNIRQSVGCFAFGISVVAVGGMMFVTSLMEYPNAYKTQEQVDETQKMGIAIGLSSLAVGLSFETLSIAIKRKRKKTVSDLVELYNNYSN